MASTTRASLKRTRSTASLNDAALDVLSDISAKSRKIQSLSPNIRRLAAKLTNRARCATSPHELDNLKDSWEALSLLIESKCEVKGLNSRLNTQRAHINKVHFDLHIGNWAMAIHNRVKAGEKNWAETYSRLLQARLAASGVPGPTAVQVAKVFKEFKAVRDHQTSQTLGHIQPEIDAVTQWHSDGTGEPPATPYLDRVAGLCGRVGIERKTYIDILHLGDSRNETAHHPPPRIEDHLDQNGNVDWSRVKRSCQNRKSRFKGQFKKGKITQAQFETFKNIIDSWYNIQVSGRNPDGTVKLAQGMDKVIEAMNQEIAKNLIPIPVPDSPYQEGKWDDLLN
ncbi:uncharacterized protein FSUBG_13590 [Fusarium subglutinans]|uniref:Uncharacterized protein n=1 Tax=Gibberella subglutinans TaxID=42677 RepID=A0A8H5KS90_GIBSU|nr:uncharacterized protein FSUBG_13590 [Fusarium subglutinans]KAF5579584.1 hypothetical protein FSUBG_13590 [Fusarium subglutinans]